MLVRVGVRSPCAPLLQDSAELIALLSLGNAPPDAGSSAQVGARDASCSPVPHHDPFTCWPSASLLSGKNILWLTASGIFTYQLKK